MEVRGPLSHCKALAFMPLVPFTPGSCGQIHLRRDHGNREAGSISVSALVTREGNEVSPSMEECLSMFTAFRPLELPEEKEHLVAQRHRTPSQAERNVGQHVGASQGSKATGHFCTRDRQKGPVVTTTDTGVLRCRVQSPAQPLTSCPDLEPL